MMRKSLFPFYISSQVRIVQALLSFRLVNVVFDVRNNEKNIYIIKRKIHSTNSGGNCKSFYSKLRLLVMFLDSVSEAIIAEGVSSNLDLGRL